MAGPNKINNKFGSEWVTWAMDTPGNCCNLCNGGCKIKSGDVCVAHKIYSPPIYSCKAQGEAQYAAWGISPVPPWEDEEIMEADGSFPTEVDKGSGSTFRSQCPKCGKKYGYFPNGGYVCEEAGGADPCYTFPNNRTPLVKLDGNPLLPKELTLISFSYKGGVPEAKRILDVRSTVRNPWENEILRKLNGLDSEVQAFVGRCRGGKLAANKVINWAARGTTIAVGCMGGRHRSVAIVEMAAKELAAKGWVVHHSHRDLKVKE